MTKQDNAPQEGTDSTTPAEMTIEQAKAEIEKLRKEAAGYRTKNKDLQALVDVADSSKSEVEKLTAQVVSLQSDVETARSEALRNRIATEHGVSADDAAMFLVGSDEDTLRAQAKRLADKAEVQKRNGTVVPGEGKQPQIQGDSELSEFTRSLFAAS